MLQEFKGGEILKIGRKFIEILKKNDKELIFIFHQGRFVMIVQKLFYDSARRHQML